MTRSAVLRLIRFSIAGVIILAIALFAISRSRNFALGPQITIDFPTNGLSTTSPSIIISGQVHRAKNFLINNSESFIDENGNFKSEILLFKGLNTITLTAKDQFGRDIRQEISIYGNVI